MAKWGTYPPDEQLRLKRNAAEETAQASHRQLYANLCKVARENGADAPETLAALAAVRRSGRAISQHYAGVAARTFGRI